MKPYPGYSPQASNQINGKFFEEAFEKSGRIQGYLVQKTELSARRVAGSRIVTMKSDLDFKVANKMGQVGFFDCKSFERPFFTYSDIRQKQIERARVYWEWRISTGFVAWFRSINKVCLFGPWDLEQRKRLTPENCFRDLGKIEDVCFSALFTTQPRPGALLQPVDRGSCRPPSSRR